MDASRTGERRRNFLHHSRISYPRRHRVFLICLVGSILWLSKAIIDEIHRWDRSRVDQPNLKQPDELFIPKNVWQLYTTVGARDARPSHAEAIVASAIEPHCIMSWIPVDGNWTYSFLGTEAGEAFVRKHYANQSDIIRVYTSMNVPVMKSDFLRYLILATMGGVYADSDVEMIKPLHQWVPDEFRNATRAMVGIERDMPSDIEWGHWSFRFVQHTLVMAKEHPIMVNMIRSITEKMLALERRRNTAIDNLVLHDFDVVNITGPKGFMDIVFKYLSAQAGRNVDWPDVTDMTKPMLFGDTLILPINYFAAGQQHSGSIEQSPDRLVQHYWKGTWRHWEEPLPRR
ncbi:MAG: hypothetical protein MMC23_004696 [Stictis urceolatum]|nr:hypothetical protein [Stictis urceolata]